MCFIWFYCTHGPKEEQLQVEVGPPWLNKVESESESKKKKKSDNCKLRTTFSCKLVYFSFQWSSFESKYFIYSYLPTDQL